MANPINIHHYTGGPNGEDLTRLHFQETQPHSHEFQLFKDEDPINPIPTEPDVLRSHEDFEFQYNSLHWRVTKFRISEHKQKAHGHWDCSDLDSNDDPESGTFQAQGGGSAEGELKASASAP